jgi:hypothetical protein
VFGCACWPNLRPYNNIKLQFRSTQCVFLGYSTRHKGFKCLEVASGRVYISRDVVFDENIYPFSALHPNAGARLRNEILLLPPSLLNPSLGDEQTCDSSVFNSPPANPTNEYSGSATNSGEVHQKSGENPESTDHYFMWPGTGSTAGPGANSQADTPATAGVPSLPVQVLPSEAALPDPVQPRGVPLAAPAPSPPRGGPSPGSQETGGQHLHRLRRLFPMTRRQRPQPPQVLLLLLRTDLLLPVAVYPILRPQHRLLLLVRQHAFNREFRSPKFILMGLSGMLI